jgi:hypothetical protein
VILIDEGALVKLTFFKEVVSLLMRMTNTVLLIYSTNKGRKNFFSKLVNIAADYPHIFVRQVIDLLCTKCAATGGRPSDCKHLDYLLPEWNSAGRNEVVRILIDGDEQMYMREAQGHIPGEMGCVCHPAWVHNLRKKPPVGVRDSSQVIIFNAFDPSGGGEDSISSTALCSIVQYRGGHVVGSQSRFTIVETIIVGMATVPLDDYHTLRAYLCQYFTNLLEQYPRATFVHMTEANYGGSVLSSVFADSVAAVIPPEQNLEVRRTKEVHGLVTTNAMKESAVYSVAVALSANMVSFADPLICHSKRAHDMERSKHVFLEQLENLKAVPIGSTGKIKYTAKDKGDGSRDDLITAFLLVYIHTLVLQRMNPGLVMQHPVLTSSVPQDMVMSAVPGAKQHMVSDAVIRAAEEKVSAYEQRSAKSYQYTAQLLALHQHSRARGSLSVQPSSSDDRDGMFPSESVEAADESGVSSSRKRKPFHYDPESHSHKAQKIAESRIRHPTREMFHMEIW